MALAKTLALSDMTVEVEDFVAQFNEWLREQPTWKGELVTQTSQHLIELISTVGTYDQATLIRAHEDSFSETAQSDDAIRAITTMQGLRMTRMGPAQVTASVYSAEELTIAPYTQWALAGTNWFNREQVVFEAGQELVVDLHQGLVKSVIVEGSSSQDYQAFISREGGFRVSDFDVQVRVNGMIQPRTFGNLWNYPRMPAYADLTTNDGRLLVQFGNSRFGTVPEINDQVVITYVVTDGEETNNLITLDRRVTVETLPDLEGEAITNPQGGTGIKPVVVYKNVASGAFGTNESAVTKSHYLASVASYPGVIDAVTQAQREINPMDLWWMNGIRVSALTTSPWTQQQKEDFIRHQESVSMYSTKFYWVDAEPVDRDIEVEVYVFNTAILSESEALAEEAVRDLLAAKPGILMTDHYESDIDSAIKKANRGQVSYVKVISPPSGEMVVNAPSSPSTRYSFIPGGAVRPLGPGVYAYSVAVITEEDEGPPSGWVHPQITNSMGSGQAIRLEWPEVRGATEYRVYGRMGGKDEEPLGLMATIPANESQTYATFVDDGSVTPVAPLPATISQSPIRYNRIRSLLVKAFYSSRQKRLDGNPEMPI